MNEQLEEINRQAQELVEEIKKYKAASSVNEASAKSLSKVADAIDEMTEKIRPLTGMGFLRLQYISIALSIVNLALLGFMILN